MEKTYQPDLIEKKWYQTWEKANYFAPRGQGKPYCIMLPPPNITGSLHMGHGFQHTLMDALTRYHRMQGDKTLWQVGTDHAGISTQLIVERQLDAHKKSRHSLGRDAFINQVWQWKETSGKIITQQLRRMGSSVDWLREKFTLDENLSHAVQQVFIQLFEEGLIYRGKRLVNWDPKLCSAISDLEVVSTEEAGHLWYIRYPIYDSDTSLTIATTRPETLLGDTALAVHPADKRYQSLIGKQVKLPLTDRIIPIIGDEFVDPDFASGCVKLTPAHDFNDYAIGKRHHLELINIFTPDIKLNTNVPVKYQGLGRYEARIKIVEDLKLQGFLEKIEKHRLSVPRTEKTGQVVEPYLTDQWFVKVGPLAQPAIKAVEDNKIRFIPENWKKTYYQWMHNIEDWCISRQLWWGHRIPAWYDEKGNYYVGKNENDVRGKHKLPYDVKLKQDEDVLDTWFSSALWPFSTLGWPEKTRELQTFYPTNVLITGFDIIFFWVARMIMMGLKFTGTVPFKEVYVTGLIRDAEGKKMSKSKGNIIDPIDIIDGISAQSLVRKRTKNLVLNSQAQKIANDTLTTFPQGIPAYGTDALRFTFCALANTGRDINFDLGRIAGYRNFCNKLWNGARFVLLNAEGEDSDLGDGPLQFSMAEQWILSLLQNVIEKTHDHFKCYRFDLLANSLYEFIWHEYCDWYLELAKLILASQTSTAAQKRGTRHVLIQVLETVLRLLHPIMPFITEEIWQRVSGLVGKTGDSIMLEPYPNPDKKLIDKSGEQEFAWLKAIIIAIRKVRGENNIAPNKKLPIFIKKHSPKDKRRLDNFNPYLISLAKLTTVNYLKITDKPAITATVFAHNLEIHIPLAELINKKTELTRLDKTIKKFKKELSFSNDKLNNLNFINRAPQEIVAKEKSRHAQLKSAIEKLKNQLTQIENV